MTPEEMQKKIEELEAFKDKIEKYFVSGDIRFSRNVLASDGCSIRAGRANGLKIATETDQKIGFFGVDPVDQRANITKPNDEASNSTAIGHIIDGLEELGLFSDS